MSPRMPPPLILLAGLPLSLGACGGLTEPDRLAVSPVVISRDFVRDQEGVDVPFEIVNQSSGTVYLPGCGAQVMIVVEYQNAGRWTRYGGGACIAVLSMDPIPLAPDDSIASRVWIGGAGRFHLRVLLAQERSGPWALGRASADFQVH